MGLLENKIAVITGGTRGLGLAIAQAFAREGAAVVVASRSAQSVTQAVESLRAEGAQASGLACDVAELAQVEALAAHAVNTLGRFDIWVNNAGITPAYGPTVHIQPQAFVQATQTNILGTYHGSVVALRHFAQTSRQAHQYHGPRRSRAIAHAKCLWLKQSLDSELYTGAGARVQR